MDFWSIFLMVSVLGTVILATRTKQERHLIFFMIRTKRFINILDKVANLAPGLWKFLADLAIVVSFSGLGAGYISRYHKQGRKKGLDNLDIILLLIGILAILVWWRGAFFFFFALAMLVLWVFVIRRLNNPTADFLTASLLISLIGSRFLIHPFLAVGWGVFGMPSIIITGLVNQAYLILFQSSTMPGVSPFIPATRDGEVGLSAPGYDLFIPLGYAALALLITLVSHESAHGILARVHGIKIKSTGILTLGILPIGAFVEPDEKEMEKCSSIKKTHIFAVGSFANLVVGLIAAMLVFSVPLLPIDASGMEIVGLEENSPAKDVLENGMILYEINGVPVAGYSMFNNVTSKLKPGDEINLTTDDGVFSLILEEHPENESRGYIGILTTAHTNGIIDMISTALFWIAFINICIGLVNLVPMIPFDGWLILREIVLAFNIREAMAKKIITGIVVMTFLLFVLNALPLFGMLGDYMDNIIVGWFPHT